jgi:hypothetical protein
VPAALLYKYFFFFLNFSHSSDYSLFEGLAFRGWVVGSATSWAMLLLANFSLKVPVTYTIFLKMCFHFESSYSINNPGLAIKNPPKKTQKTHLKNPLKMFIFILFFVFSIFYENNTNFCL